MSFTNDDKKAIKDILHETIMEDHKLFDDLLKNVKKFRESPEGRLAIVETKVDELKDDIDELRDDMKEFRKELKSDIKENRNLMIWMFGIMMTIYGGLIVFLISRFIK
ncbi:MAG: hypothetical protein SCARUB_03901 [Candidatus Scalindua rubra]|uniref:Uncharacterized protein n=1 Tax=Candidatus Scalindua rubra TaxID=1872076 RepID=A0A1E3X5S6_9BACT|nr:MAG: hypothetical protein SCARUB_03901 [Candidatus Scalindua rubra]